MVLLTYNKTLEEHYMITENIQLLPVVKPSPREWAIQGDQGWGLEACLPSVGQDGMV